MSPDPLGRILVEVPMRPKWWRMPACSAAGAALLIELLAGVLSLPSSMEISTVTKVAGLLRARGESRLRRLASTLHLNEEAKKTG